MGNLAQEYRSRYGIDCICPVNEGVLFFNRDSKPALFVITSSLTKSWINCSSCIRNPGSIVLEIFQAYQFPKCIKRIAHTHMPPDANILDYITNHVADGEQYVPYISTGERDQEKWIWEFLLQTGILNSLNTHRKMLDGSWIDQAMWLMQNFPEYYKLFYNNLYTVCMINRSYILVN